MSNPIEKLVHELSKLPSVGEKTALRLALHILRQPIDYGRALAKAVNETVEQICFCENCYNLSLEKLCKICCKPSRVQEMICVVEDIADLLAIERTHHFSGQYHVLHGALSPIDGIGPEELKIKELLVRLQKHPEIQEIIIATNPNVNGEATALYLSKLLKPFDHIKVTKLASGIPVGGHIEYLDPNTITQALERRLEFV